MKNLLSMRRNSYIDSEPTIWDDSYFRNLYSIQDLMQGMFRVDMRDEPENYIIEAELPGIKREAIRIDVDDGMLIISATLKNEIKGEQAGDYIINERRTGRFQRAFAINNVVEDEITAEYNDGLLVVKLPKRNEVRRTPRRISLS